VTATPLRKKTLTPSVPTPEKRLQSGADRHSIKVEKGSLVLSFGKAREKAELALPRDRREHHEHLKSLPAQEKKQVSTMPDGQRSKAKEPSYLLVKEAGKKKRGRTRPITSVLSGGTPKIRHEAAGKRKTSCGTIPSTGAAYKQESA